MLSVLRGCGALAAVAPEIDALYSHAAAGPQPDLGVAAAEALDRGARAGGRAGRADEQHPVDAPLLPVQFGILGRHMNIAAAQSLSTRIRAAAACAMRSFASWR